MTVLGEGGFVGGSWFVVGGVPVWGVGCGVRGVGCGVWCVCGGECFPHVCRCVGGLGLVGWCVVNGVW